MAKYTITHSEETGGWTSFWNYSPDWMMRLGRKFFSIKNGQLWEHHDEANPVMNNFYGTQYNTSIKTVFNDAMADDKIFKELATESDEKWAAAIATNYTDSTIKATEFTTKESRQFSFIRKNEDDTSLKGSSAQGIGVIASVTIQGQLLYNRNLPTLISVGDEVYQINGSQQELIGTILDIDRALRIILMDVVNPPVPGFYTFAKKNARVEGEATRGYYMEVTLTCSNNDYSELYAVEAGAVKSYV